MSGVELTKEKGASGREVRRYTLQHVIRGSRGPRRRRGSRGEGGGSEHQAALSPNLRSHKSQFFALLLVSVALRP